MTEGQKTMARALAACTFVPGISTKRFARDMAHLADHGPDLELSPRQAEYLRTAVIRYRRQIPRDVVQLAESLEVQAS